MVSENNTISESSSFSSIAILFFNTLILWNAITHTEVMDHFRSKDDFFIIQKLFNSQFAVINGEAKKVAFEDIH